jgi:hypothetical protein
MASFSGIGGLFRRFGWPWWGSGGVCVHWLTSLRFFLGQHNVGGDQFLHRAAELPLLVFDFRETPDEFHQLQGFRLADQDVCDRLSLAWCNASLCQRPLLDLVEPLAKELRRQRLLLPLPLALGQMLLTAARESLPPSV